MPACRYGELGNAELVKKYGFALRQNPFTTVQLDKPALLAAAQAVLGPARWRRRSGLLRRGSEVMEAGKEPFEVGWVGWAVIGLLLYVSVGCLCA
jgi:SET domain-containing protein 6